MSPIVYIIALLISVIATIIASLSNKGKVTINNQTYEEKGSFNIVANNDDYIRQTTSSVRIVSNNSNSSGGGRSSTHTSSSGRSHGGGGRKF